jgi:hypothetical protein
MESKSKMLIVLNITDNNMVKIEEITQLLLENNAISILDYSNVLTATMCFKALNQKQEELPSNVIAFEAKKDMCL